MTSVALGNTPDIDINARAYVLVDPVSGRVLVEKSADSKMPMASTTKIMTAILALETGDLSSIVTTSAKAASIGGSSLELSAGDQFILEDMLYGLLLPSGNDAAVAIAEHIAGEEDIFIEMMNQKAVELGALCTHYQNPHGLDSPKHFSTAKDLALIAQYGWQIPMFRKITGSSKKTIGGSPRPKEVYNTNRLLIGFEGANGIKTGFTGKAGRCLIASAERNDLHLMSVVLGAGDHFSASANLLNYGFEKYKTKEILNRKTVLPTISVKKGKVERLHIKPSKSLSLPLKDGEEIELKYILPKEIPAPIMKNSPIGVVEIWIDQVPVITLPLVAVSEVVEKNILDYYFQLLKHWHRLNPEEFFTVSKFIRNRIFPAKK